MTKNRFDREVRVYVSNGAVAQFTIREMYRFYRSWQMWLMVLVGLFIMSTGHPVTLPQFDSFGLRMAFWLIALAIYLALSEVYAVSVCGVWNRIVGGPIPLIILAPPLMLAATYVTVAMLTLLFEPGRATVQNMTWQMNVRNVLVAHVFETVAMVWLIPAQRVAGGRPPGADRTITLAGRRFVLHDIARVKAAEHYLEIHTVCGVEVIRERMATFLEQVAPGDGIQTHRSHWVACGSAVSLTGARLRLANGEKVPVARGRQEDVRAWLASKTEVAAPV